MHAVFMITGVRRYVDEFFDWRALDHFLKQFSSKPSVIATARGCGKADRNRMSAHGERSQVGLSPCAMSLVDE